jgi:hypothetical protein
MLPSFTALAALLVSLALPTAPDPARAEAPARRPVVLLVHGRGQVGDSALLHRAATRALQDGAESVSGSSLLRDSDVRLVWYADVLEGGNVSSSACRPAPTPSANRSADAGARGSATDAGALDMFSLVAGAFLAFAGDDFDGTPMASVRSLIGDVRFLTNPVARCVAESRIGSAIAGASREGRPVILVGHSLGGLMAWGHLQNRANHAAAARTLPAVLRFVTLGSPVGSPEVRRFVFGSPGTLGLPAGVGSWINVVDADDPFAAPLLSGLEADTATTLAATPGLRDAMTESRRTDAHALRGYLRDPAATHAILDAWCSTMREDRESEAACATLALTSPIAIAR